MGRIPPEDLEAVRTKIPIAEVIGEHIALKAAGTSMKGLCPFHQEKTPSFNVNTTTNHFYCFGCEESGDVIDFIQKIEGEGFRWAVKFLADQYNIPVHFDAEDEGPHSNKSRLIEAHDLASSAYAWALRNDTDAQTARDLLTSRGFDVEQSITHFGCGYAPTSRSVCDLLQSKGFTRAEIIEAGLGYERGSKIIDRFRDRLLWTIRNSFGKPIGFGARRLQDSDSESSKFINTSETPIYKKSTVLYALDLARKNITRSRQVFVVEGYTDVMAMHLAGLTNTVAACGTAFTSDHLNALRRLVGDSGEIVFAFDDDTAGQKAATTAYREFNKSLRRLSALPQSQGLDPDELRQAEGDEALRELATKRTTLSEAVIFLVIQQMPRETPEDRIAALDAVLPYLNDISDPLVRQEYAAKVSTTLRFNPAQVEARIRPAETDRNPTAEAPQTVAVKPEWVEKEVLQVFGQNEVLAREYLADWEIDLKFSQSASEQAIDLIRRGLSIPRNDGLAWPLHLKQVAASESENKLVAALTATALPVAEDSVHEYVGELLSRLDRQESKRVVDDLKTRIATASTPAERTAALKQLMAHQRQTSRLGQR